MNEKMKFADVDQTLAAMRDEVLTELKKLDKSINAVRVSNLEELPESARDRALMLYESQPLDEVQRELRRMGFDVARSTLGKFLRRERLAEVSEARRDLEVSAKELASAGNEGKTWRAGALEAVWQKLFERAQASGSTAELLGLQERLSQEEERLKRLALEEEKARFNRESLLLQREKLQVEAARGNGRVFAEALKILLDEALDDRAKVAGAVERLKSCKGVVIDVEAAGPGAAEGGGKGRLMIDDR